MKMYSKADINYIKHVFTAEIISNTASNLHLTILKISHKMDIKRKSFVQPLSNTANGLLNIYIYIYDIYIYIYIYIYDIYIYIYIYIYI